MGPVNAFLLKRDPPVLIDTGLHTEESYDLLKRTLKEEGYAFADLGAIIATHAHRDHIGLLGRIQEATAAPTYAHVTVKDDRLEAVDEAMQLDRDISTTLKSVEGLLKRRERVNVRVISNG